MSRDSLTEHYPRWARSHFAGAKRVLAEGHLTQACVKLRSSMMWSIEAWLGSRCVSQRTGWQAMTEQFSKSAPQELGEDVRCLLGNLSMLEMGGDGMDAFMPQVLPKLFELAEEIQDRLLA